MAQYDVIIAGFGGQGVLLVGKMLAYAGMREGKEVSWIPSYGPEMRGGTCNCTVIVSDRPVGSPVVQHPAAIVVLNLPSLDKFEPLVRPGGVICFNTSLIHRRPARDDVKVVDVPANDIALQLDNPRGANMVALGSYLGATSAVSEGAVEEVIRETFAAKPGLIDVNLDAFRRGVVVGRAALEAKEVTA